MTSQHNDGLAGGPPKYFSFVETPSGALLVGTCVAGISRSTDGGTSWEPVGELDHVSVNTLAVEPAGSLLAATSGGLLRSHDDATSWEQLDPTPAYAVLADGTRGPDGVTTFRLLQLDDGRKLAGTDGHGVWVGEDAAWRPLALPDAIVYSLAETASGAILAGTRGEGVMRSDDAGRTWSSSSVDLPDVYVHCLLELGDGSILAGTGHGLSLSVDDGRSWTSYASDLNGHRVFSLRELADGRIVAGSYAHLWIGADESWQQVDPGLSPHETFSTLFGEHGEIYAGTKAGVVRSDDRGQTWHNVLPGAAVLTLAHASTGQVMAGADFGVRMAPDWRSLGDLGHRSMALFVVTPGNVLAGTLTDGLYRYRDGAWAPVPDGPPHWQIYEIIRSRTGRLLAGTGAIIDGQKVGGVFTCDDDGETWIETLSGRSYYSLTQTSDGTIYAGGRRCFISKSTDDGDSWELLPLPMGHEAKMYSLSADNADRLFIGSGGQLLRSNDGAQTWTALEEGIDGVSVYDLCQDTDGLLAAATSAGPLVSADGGDSWRAGEFV